MRRLLAAIFGERFPAQALRLGGRLLIGLLAITLGFFLLRSVVPDDPAQAMAGPGAGEAAVAAMRLQLRLDDPLPLQYADYLRHLAVADFGLSTRTHRPVSGELLEALPVTVGLLAVGGVSGIALGLLIGLFGSAGTVLRLSLTAAAAVPVFGYTIVLLLVDALLYRLSVPHWPVHLLVSGLSLGVPVALVTGREFARDLSRAMRQAYARAARAAGRSVLGTALRHGLRNSLAGPLTALGLHAGVMFVTLLMVERLFGWAGLGIYLLDAVTAGDLPASLGAAMAFAVLYLLIDLTVAVLRVLAEPRLRLE